MADKHPEGYYKDYYKDKKTVSFRVSKELAEQFEKALKAKPITGVEWFKQKAMEEIESLKKSE